MSKAILIVSYGTINQKVRDITFNVFEQEVNEMYPDYKTYQAYTSFFMLKKLKEKGEPFFDVKETLENMAKDGIKEAVLIPLHVMYGGEYEKMVDASKECAYLFDNIKLAAPLLARTEDYITVANALNDKYNVAENGCLVVMGHGTDHYANSSYAALAYTVKQQGYKNIIIGTLEAYPSLDNVIDEIREYNPEFVKLVSLLLTPARHATHDMAGDDESSWKSQIIKAGFDVTALTDGLLELKDFRDIFMSHLKIVIDEM